MRDMPFHEAGPATELLLDEAFQDDRRPGRVLGSPSPDGRRRLGVDRERRMAIDHGALRFQPLARPGWGRQGIAYGPFAREAGLTLAVAVTNGHNTSEVSSLGEDLLRRLWRWARGPGIDPVPQRLRALLTGPRRRGMIRRLHVWLRLMPGFGRLPVLNDNLAVGWFGSAAPADPTIDGNGFVVHAAFGDNGELRTRHGDACLPALRGLKNVQAFYVVVLRERGAVCYAAVGPDATTLPGLPMMRPIAVDPHDTRAELYAGVHQSTIGQIGFRVDTRVHGVRIHRLPELALAGPGQLGDPLAGAGPLGNRWRQLRGEARRTGHGAVCVGPATLAVLDEPQETGLIHAMIDGSGGAGRGGIVWRLTDPGSYWALELGDDDTALVRYTDGIRVVVATEAGRSLPRDAACSVQVTDAAGRIGCSLDGALLFGGWIDAPADQAPTRAGFWLDGAGGLAVRDFETHPRAVPVPAELRFPTPWRRSGSEVVLADRFVGAGEAVDGRAPETGPGRWKRLLGRGGLDCSAIGARVQASVATPHPGRTFHALPWAQEGFADLETEILPPGSDRGEKEHCRCGLLFWQDADNYLSFSIWLCDEYKGASVAAFPKRHGFEEIYDAIWTMVGDEISWGRPFRLRVTFDGDRFVVFLNGDAITERRLTDLYPDDSPLRITAVGVATNWEWGDDTGSTFQGFTARA